MAGEKQNGTSFDLNDYTIIKEGDAEILMHAKNEVFYNKTQVFLFYFAKSMLFIFVNYLHLYDKVIKSGKTVLH